MMAIIDDADIVIDFKDEIVGYIEFEIDVLYPSTFIVYSGENLIESRKTIDY